jgi:hypothetical protein
MWACVRPAVEGPKRSPNVITAEEIPGAQARNAYEIVERLRPRWLRVPLDRSARLETVILAYVDDAKLGSVDELRAVPVEGIVSIRYLDAAQAGSLPGAGSLHVAGAVVVSTRRAP